MLFVRSKEGRLKVRLKVRKKNTIFIYPDKRNLIKIILPFEGSARSEETLNLQKPHISIQMSRPSDSVIITISRLMKQHNF